MDKTTFRARVLLAKKEQNMSKAELSRRSGVSYSAIDKFLKRPDATTSSEKATALAKALGIKVEDSDDYDELRSIYFQLSEEKKKFALMSLKGLLSD